MFKTILAVAFLVSLSISAIAQKQDAAYIAESLNGEWLTVKWVNFENINKTFNAEDQNDKTFDSLACISARPTISMDSIAFDREKACYFSPCRQPFIASTVQKLIIISTSDINQRKPGVELRVGKISKYFLRLMGQDVDMQAPMLISTNCEATDNKDEHLYIIYFNDRNIAIYSSKDVIVLKKNIVPRNLGDE